MSKLTRTIIITGSSSGIGLDVAKAFLNQGGNLVINGRDPGKLVAAAEELDTPDRVAP